MKSTYYCIVYSVRFGLDLRIEKNLLLEAQAKGFVSILVLAQNAGSHARFCMRCCGVDPGTELGRRRLSPGAFGLRKIMEGSFQPHSTTKRRCQSDQSRIDLKAAHGWSVSGRYHIPEPRFALD
jgi:hypothetical protein